VTTSADPPLRFLSASDVLAALPGVAQRIGLAERTLLALVADAQLPPKIGVTPRPAGSFAHAMPAWLHGAEPDGREDLLGIKWVAGFPANVERGLPAINGTVLLSDALSGLPRAILDAGPLTAHRTAAVSGAAIARFGPRGIDRPGVAVIGSGVQARSHLPVIAHLLPGARLVVCDRDPARSEALAAEAAAPDGARPAFDEVRVARDPAEAVEGADLVVTAITFGPQRQIVPAEAFGPGATIVAVDYDMCVPASLAANAAAFLTDDRGQFLATRSETVFAGYPEPSGALGEAIGAGMGRPDGQVLVTHLGVGLADVVFGDAVLRAAEAMGIGTRLGR
jgi:ornithine cyclodeaminase/alanine dehydrogenase-like protein (mu-crystallin family)